MANASHGWRLILTAAGPVAGAAGLTDAALSAVEAAVRAGVGAFSYDETTAGAVAASLSGGFERLGASGAWADVAPSEPGGWEAATPRRALCVALRRAAPGVDVNLLTAAQASPKRLLIADMDSTMITVECIDEIANVVGVGPRVAEITEAAMRGELDFEGALKARVALLAGAPEAVLNTVWEERVRLSPGAATAVRSMGAAGARAALVSGGFTYFTERVAAACGFHQHQANTLLSENGRLTGAPGEPILGREAKLEALERVTAEGGFGPEDALAVGDGANDLAMIRRAGLGVAYRAKPVVAAEADARLDHSDLTALLYLQGRRDESFAAA
ncbi:MAG: phosphoserine phosphatase SerB [Pseudomonadota bacterium]